ncbi:MAG: LacI family DNA-binding transcriptional regulator [Pseudomonadota bacterium]
MPLQTGPNTPVPTLEDVAKRAGVSTATVSRCMNAPKMVSEKTRQKVMQAVRDLGYAPNFGARALAARRTGTFGAVIPTMDNAIFARGLQAFQHELGQAGITTLVAASSYDPHTEEDQIRTLVARGAEALLLIGSDRTPEAYAFLQTQKIPFVNTWTYEDRPGRVCIGFDNRRAMAMLAREVLALGHRNIAYITAQRPDNDRARARFDGVCDAMRAADVDPATLMIEEVSYGIEQGRTAFGRLMDRTPHPTAVMCGNDVLAAGALREARARGIAVPDQVSITGFDDIDISEIVFPALTTVHVPHKDMGARAARALRAMCDGEVPDVTGPLDTWIAWRDSLGPAPRAANG